MKKLKCLVSIVLFFVIGMTNIGDGAISEEVKAVSESTSYTYSFDQEYKAGDAVNITENYYDPSNGLVYQTENESESINNFSGLIIDEPLVDGKRPLDNFNPDSGLDEDATVTKAIIRATKMADDKYGEGNWSFDWDSLHIGQRNGSDIVHITVRTNASSNLADKTINGDKIVYHLPECVYEQQQEECKDIEKSLDAKIDKDRRELSGKESLYQRGDEITISGIHCNHIMKYYQKCMKHIKRYDAYDVHYKDVDVKDEEGNVIGSKRVKTGETWLGAGHEIKSGCGKTKNKYYIVTDYPVKITLDGFKVNDAKEIEFNFDGAINKYTEESSIKEREWKTDPLKITEVESVHYDEERGAFYGIIKITCECCKGGCEKEFKIYFGDRGTDPELQDLTVKVSPSGGGSARVTGMMDTDGDGKVEENPVTVTVTGESTLRVIPGNIYEVQGVASSGHVYKYVVSPDGNVLGEENPYSYTMLDVPSTIIVHFASIKSSAHTLYITSNEGGKAWTDTRPAGSSYSVLNTSLGSGKVKVEKISGIKAGEEIELKCEADEGYEFVRWDYRPYVLEEVGGNKPIIYMPNSDLTATAIFRNIPAVSDKPILKVTSNNEEWGTAYAIVNGSRVSITEAVVGNEYVIEFDAKPGYYFTNWVYDSKLSPFKDAKNRIIVMPVHDLEITAFFAPYPTTGGSSGNTVTFVAETEDKAPGVVPGTVPEDLFNIAAGAEVSFGVTANNGYEFAYWYFTSGGKIIAPDAYYDDFGSGMFVMPDYAVIAHAVFKEYEAANLTILIEGNGSVTADGKDAPSGTIISVSKGAYVELVATPDENNKFLYWTDEEGNILSDEEKIFYPVDEDGVIIAHFAEKDKYTLYVSSTVGGTAWTDGNDKHSKDSIIEETDKLGKTVYKIVDVFEGEEFTVYYSAYTGYSFDEWEFTPYIITDSSIEEKSYGQVLITMPSSDLTVNAVFNKDTVEEPVLKVTSNNKNWGKAWAVVDGKDTEMDKAYKVTSGKAYELDFDVEPGYYFVKWSYSTSVSPFTGINEFIMPSRDLEIMAIFAPVTRPGPGVDPDSGKYSIDFIASPPEGGRVPEDLSDIKTGSKVTIDVTPNDGWEFDYWYFTDANGNPIEVEIHVDSDGSGYFIMPNVPVRAIAVFTEVDGYNLYVVSTIGGTAWVMDGNSKSIRIKNALPEKVYELGYEATSGYEFVDWEFRWEKYGESSIGRPDINKKDNLAVMPYSDLTVTAVFKKIEPKGDFKVRVISNNYLWGDAWVEVDGDRVSWREEISGVVQQGPSDKEGIRLEAGKDYRIGYSAEDGFIYTGCLPATWIVERSTSDGSGYLVINIPEEYLTSDVEFVVYFKPGVVLEEMFNLMVRMDPEDAGVVTGSESGLKKGDPYTVNVKEVKDGYKFKYWYYMEGSRKVIVTTNKMYTGNMPGHDLELIAYVGNKGTGGGGAIIEDEKPDDNVYYIIVDIEGQGSVTDNGGRVVTVKEMKDGEKIVLVANPAAGYEFVGWTIGGKIVSTSPRTEFTIDGATIKVTACFKLKTESSADEFKIISVRDLRWKDYFVQGSSLTGNVFTIPSSGTMLKSRNNLPDVLKMGYAVEFELTTSQIIPEKTVLVIEPVIINNNTGSVVPWKDIKDELSKTKITDNKNGTDFTQIVIYGNGDSHKQYTKMYQTSAKVDEAYKNNGMSINKITWNWLYYLPADIYFSGYNKNSDITVRFIIELHETEDGKTVVRPKRDSSGKVIKDQSGTLKEDLVGFEQYYTGTQWKGDVYKYSLGESLLDDIYNNAQN